MNNKFKKLIVSSSMMVAALTALAGATYALFSDTVTANNHIEAGTLKVGFKRTSKVLDYYSQEEVKRVQDVDSTIVDLREDANKQFAISGFVPTTSLTMDYEISNLGNTIFDCGFRLVFDDTKWEAYEGSTKQGELLKQLDLTITSDSQTLYDADMYSYYEGTTKDFDLGYLKSGNDVKTFSVKIEFRDDDNINNDVMGFAVDFDIQAYATQKTN